jgi:hypothetical protein
VINDRETAERQVCKCGRPLNKGETRCPHCTWCAAGRWKVPLKWIARGAGTLAVIIFSVFTKIKFRPHV